MPTAANAAELAQRHSIGVGAAALAEAKFAITRDFLAKDAFPLMPGVREVLPRLRATGLRLGIVTGAGKVGVEATLRAHGLQGVFETVVTSDDVTRSKPAPECYLLAASRLGLAPADCVAIEDTEHGVSAAAGAGLRCLAVPNEMSRHHDFSRATAVFASLVAAAGWIEARARET
jgi:HAD superfamily hydrolase (TIGR01509 family)